MKYLSYVLVLFCVCSIFGQSTQIVVDSAGRKILLKPDKTWDYVAEKVPEPKATDGKIVGDDAKDIAYIMQNAKGSFNKSEFETEKQYLDRINELAKNTFSKKTQKSLSETVFVYNDLADYDAESQAFRLSLFKLKLQEIRHPSGMAIVERQYGSWSEMPGMDTFRVPMKPEAAQLVKPDIALAIYGLPVAVEPLFETIKLRPTKYVVFNRKTGEVYLTKESDSFRR